MKPEDFTKEKFLLKLLVNASLETTFQAFTTTNGLTSWFLDEVKFINEKKASYRRASSQKWRFLYLEMAKKLSNQGQNTVLPKLLFI